MDAANLHSIWASPDNSRLTPKQSSFRLPVHVAAKLAALADLYPQKSKTQIVGDLLSSALDQMAQGLPSEPGEYFGDNENGEEFFVAVGLAQDYRTLTNKYFKEIEKELGTERPEDFFNAVLLVKKSEK